MKYDKKAISNTAQNLRSKTSGLSSVQTRLGRISPTKCSSAFYTRRSSLVRRLSNVQSEIKSLSTDIGNAASKMSSDDVQNARYIRQVFNNRTSKLNFGQRTFSAGNTTLKRGGLFGSSLMYTQMAMNRRPVSSLGNASSGYTPWFVKAGNFISSGASSIGKKAGEFGSNVWNGTTNFFSKAGKWTADRFNDAVDWGKSAGDYTWKSLKKLVLGDYSDDDITALSFGGSIAAGLFDVDLPLDVRDFVYDIQHWGEGENFGVNFTLDCVAFLPLIGAVKYVKYADEVAEVADGAKDIGKVMEAASDAGKYSDQAVEAAKQARKAEKVAGAAVDAGKTSDTVVDVVEDATNIGRKADVATEAGKAIGDIPKKTFSELPDNVQESYKKYDKISWSGNFENATPGTSAGRKYKNRDGLLPNIDKNGGAITYKEYDVNNLPAGATSRDGCRFVRGSDGSIYYTSDHYKTFIKIE